LQRDIKKIRDETLEAINQILIGYAKKSGIENGLKVTGKTIGYAKRAVELLDGETVPANEKVVSIFEPHTDIIVKDRRDTPSGLLGALPPRQALPHWWCFGIDPGLRDPTVQWEGNPADSTLAVDMMKRHKQNYGYAPRQAAFDGGFTSIDNLAEIKRLGVRDVAFSKRRGLEITEMAKSSWVYKRLRNFRAGIEGTISFLKRCFGLSRCTLRSLASFRSYAWSSVVCANLLVIARHALQ